MFIVLDFLSKRVRVAVHQSQNRVIPLLSIDLKIMAAYAVAAVAGKIKSKAVTIKLKTFRLFTIAGNFPIWIFLLRLVAIEPWLWVPIANFSRFFVRIDWSLGRLALLFLTSLRLVLLAVGIRLRSVGTFPTLVWTLHLAGIVLAIFWFILKYDDIRDVRLLVNEHKSWMLFDYRRSDLVNLSREVVVEPKGVAVGIISFWRYGKRR